MTSVSGDTAEQFYINLCHKFVYLPSALYKFYKILYKFQRVLKRLFKFEVDATTKIDANYILEYAEKSSIDVLWFGYGNVSYNLIKIVKEKNQN